MIFAEFEHAIDAAFYRKNHGGWIAVAGDHVYWFSAQHFTPSTIIHHRILRGHDASIFCDDRLIPAMRKSDLINAIGA